MAEWDELRRSYKIALTAVEDLEALAGKETASGGAGSERLHQLIVASMIVLREAEHLLGHLQVVEPPSIGGAQTTPLTSSRALVPDNEPINRAVRRCAYLLGHTADDIDRLFAALRRLNTALAPDHEIVKSTGWASRAEVREILPSARVAVTLSGGTISAELLDVLGAALGWTDTAGAFETQTKSPSRASRARR